MKRLSVEKLQRARYLVDLAHRRGGNSYAYADGEVGELLDMLPALLAEVVERRIRERKAQPQQLGLFAETKR